MPRRTVHSSTPKPASSQNRRSSSIDTVYRDIVKIIKVGPPRHKPPKTGIGRSTSKHGSASNQDDDGSSSSDGQDAKADMGSAIVKYLPTAHFKFVESSDHTADSKRVLTGINNVIDPTNSESLKTVTVELEMVAREDLEEPIEEFHRLSRLGRFKEAKQLFNDHLGHHLDKESVRVPQGEMALARGDYGTFAAMREKEKAILERAKHDQSRDPDDQPFPVLHLLWGLRDIINSLNYEDIRLSASMSQRLVTVHDFDNVFPDLPVPSWAFWVNKKLLSYYIRLGRGHEFDLDSFSSHLRHMHWRGIYDGIVANGRIWELSDTIALMTSVFHHTEGIGTSLFSTSNAEVIFSTILDDWRLDAYDETTELALLDMFTTLLLKMYHDDGSDRGHFPAGKRCLQATKELATHIMKNDPESMRSRPFLRYSLAQVSIQIWERQAWRTNLATTSDLSGLFLWQRDCNFELDIYVPEPGEQIPSPDYWRIQNVPTKALTVIRNAARDLGDYRLEADCLKHLAVVVEDPTQHLRDLGQLQEHVQHDGEGYLKTLLASYLLAPPTHESKQQFLSSLLAVDQLANRCGIEISPNLLWAKAMITARVMDCSPLENSWVVETLRLAPGLSGYIRDFVQHKLQLDVGGYLAERAMLGDMQRERKKATSAEPDEYHDKIEHYYNKVKQYHDKLEERIQQPSRAKPLGRGKKKERVEPRRYRTHTLAKDKDKGRKRDRDKDTDKDAHRYRHRDRYDDGIYSIKMERERRRTWSDIEKRPKRINGPLPDDPTGTPGSENAPAKSAVFTGNQGVQGEGTKGVEGAGAEGAGADGVVENESDGPVVEEVD